MKKKKLLLTCLGFGVLAVGLSACTASFCSVEDKSSIMYAYDIYHVVDKEGNEVPDLYSFGVSTYYDKGTSPNGVKVYDLEGFDKIEVAYNVDNNLAIKQIETNAVKQNIRVDDYSLYFGKMDDRFLNLAIDSVPENVRSEYNLDRATMTAKDIQILLMGTPENTHGSEDKSLLRGYGFTKYYSTDPNNYWVNFDKFNSEVRKEIGVDFCPSSDYIKLYKQSMMQYAAQTTSCIALEDGFYGYYGFDNNNKTEVFIQAKDFDYAWSKGFLEGLLIYPISWLIDSTSIAFMGGIGAGLAQVLAIFVITFLIRALMMLVTINQTTMNAKMTEIQPEVAKIQAKYPNSNTNRNEQQQMAMEMQALYKKNKIHPFRSILVMIIQFPVFICVWGAMQGSALLSSDAFLGLRLSESVMSTLMNTALLPSNETGWWTALVVFIIMAALQTVAMLLPQWIQKRKQKKALVHTGKNPGQKHQQNTMKIVTIVMLVMIIFMGLSLASGMVIYWIAGSIWSIAQTLIIEWIMYLKHNKKHNKPNKKKPVATTDKGQIVEDAVVLPEYMQAPTGKKKYKDKE